VPGITSDRRQVIYLNGKPLQEPYIQHISPGIERYRDNFRSAPWGPVVDRGREMLANHVTNGELVVPESSYFAMGDNRDNSLDSRYGDLCRAKTSSASRW